MKVLAANVVLAITWAMGSGQISLMNLVAGFALGYVALWFARPVLGQTAYFNRVWQVLAFLLFFFWELVLANLRVAYDVLTPKFYMRPGIIAVPLDAKSDLEITLFANLLTLTPGSLAVDVSPDRKTLYVHEMFVDDLEQTRRKMKCGFERRVLEVLR